MSDVFPNLWGQRRMRESTNIHFVTDPLQFRAEGTHVGHVPAAVSGKEQLMRALEEALRLPDYFGRNWDALSDCLTDLSWLQPGRVTLVHDAVPGLSSNDLRTYVDVLATAVSDWKRRASYELVVVFPERDRDRLLELISTPPTRDML
jgi:RNAse (barnase) inhibitor barstar